MGQYRGNNASNTATSERRTNSAMETYDFRAQRLFVPDDLAPGVQVHLDRDRAHYVGDVIRLGVGAAIHLFNGRDGEWRAVRAPGGRREVVLTCETRLRAQTAPSTLDHAFAPLKHARLDYMVQKSVEMGAGRLVPVLTRHTQVSRVNIERMRANVIEAAEQCGILDIPQVLEPLPFARWLANLEPERRVVFCDEAASPGDGLAALAEAAAGPLAVAVGPEGGFSDEERRALKARPGTLVLSLGPRILRADTAAVAALALIEAARPQDDQNGCRAG